MLTTDQLHKLKSEAAKKDNRIICELVDEILLNRNLLKKMDPDKDLRKSIKDAAYYKRLICVMVNNGRFNTSTCAKSTWEDIADIYRASTEKQGD